MTRSGTTSDATATATFVCTRCGHGTYSEAKITHVISIYGMCGVVTMQVITISVIIEC